ncbi:hypothetical protein Q5424_12655 [Conexibacter sp. JD483]|uniref:hypothetical protein n=1 Tax=unclassified Conexibacter TaxID=2627773 RepID=UPI0027197249|nr:MULTISPECIES: hypothetical protein [unclassified Conexibacter]MDO8186882.1 hypothetical protein [Conexibacter sp. CPCC 205706]MDO8200806.1 hypothetical protein [Conexibacter sp. CPCC 205762]MDR9369942.1 hypothetical protein [Conexibacter sp. JD483]
MNDTTIEHTEDFPHVGFRARRWLRFERDLAEWLATPEGRFTQWCARQLVAAPPTAPLDSADAPR